ncbi:hypothetical protein [Archaeoglobus sp.]
MIRSIPFRLFRTHSIKITIPEVTSSEDRKRLLKKMKMRIPRKINEAPRGNCFFRRFNAITIAIRLNKKITILNKAKIISAMKSTDSRVMTYSANPTVSAKNKKRLYIMWEHKP